MSRQLLGFCSAVLATTLVAAPANAHAQSAQPWSLQGSLLLANVDLGGKQVGGAGIEAQLRYTPASLFSLGAGFQSTAHESGGEKLTMTGVFVEPRYALDIGSDHVAPYLAGRVALLSQTSDLKAAASAKSSGFAIGAGGGLLFKASKTVNFDLGVAFVNQSFGDATGTNPTTGKSAVVHYDSFFGYVVKGGISVGFGSR